MVQAYAKMQVGLAQSGLDIFMSGSTATTIFVNRERLISFNVGDSTAVLVEVDENSNVSVKGITK